MKKILTIVCLFLLCAIPVYPALVDKNADGPFSGGGTNEADYFTLVKDMWEYQDSWGNRTVYQINCTFGTCAWNPKSSLSNNNSAMNGANGKSKSPYSNTSNFLVTDEFSQVALVTSMADNGTRMAWVLNTVRWINGTSASRGFLPLWCVSIDDANHLLNTSCTTDTASDGDARILDALLTCSANTNFNASLRDDCYNYSVQMAADFHAKDMFAITKTYAGDSSQSITRWICGGANVCSAITNSGFMYSGYYGDNAIAMLKACKRTGNLTYCGDSNNMTMQAIQAGGNSSVGYWDNNCRLPQGVHHKFDSSSPVRPVCTNTCTSTGGYWDYDDAPRYTALGVFMYQYNWSVGTPNANLTENLQNLSGKGSVVSSTSFAPQISPDCRGSTKNSGFYESTYGAQLFMWTNTTLVENLIDTATGSSHYNTGTHKWDSGDYGVYRQTRPVRMLGIMIGLDNQSYAAYSSTPDTTPPVISTVSCGTPSNTLMTITWNTDETANQSVDYGTTTALSNNNATITTGTSHSVQISGLIGNTLYFFNVTSWDTTGNKNSTGNGTAHAPFNCTTAAVSDTTPPLMTNLLNSSISGTTAIISWTTDESANSTVNYGTTTALGTFDGSSSYTTIRTISLNGLQTNTFYYWNATSCDVSGNCNATTKQFNFTTLSTDCITDNFVAGNKSFTCSTNGACIFRGGSCVYTVDSVNDVNYVCTKSGCVLQ